jgi:endonuclease YncB( thermonuclease family)
VRPTGPVVSVLDSNTIEVLHNNRAERIRLSGIDCPEKGQAFGSNAKHAASALAFGKDVTISNPADARLGKPLDLCSNGLLLSPKSLERTCYS